MKRVRETKHIVLLAIIVGALISQSLAPYWGAVGPLFHEVLITIVVLAVFRIVFDSRVD